MSDAAVLGAGNGDEQWFADGDIGAIFTIDIYIFWEDGGDFMAEIGTSEKNPNPEQGTDWGSLFLTKVLSSLFQRTTHIG